MIEFKINGKPVKVNVPPDTPLLWVIREELKMTGTKFGCGKGLCGACTVHLNGEATRTCILPVVAVSGQEVTTIEGLASSDKKHPVQQAWIAQNVPQCGYCQSGQIMQAVSLLKNTEDVTDEQIDSIMSGNICRCGSYVEIKKAIKQAAGLSV